MPTCLRRSALRPRLLTTAVALLGTLVSTPPALATPLVQNVSGTLSHGGTVTITGAGFGSKSKAAPLVWDNASGNSINDKWTGGWPSQLPGYNLGYYAPMRGISLPHSHVTRYIAGAHAANTGANSGYAVMMYKSMALPAYESQTPMTASISHLIAKVSLSPSVTSPTPICSKDKSTWTASVISKPMVIRPRPTSRASLPAAMSRIQSIGKQ